MTLSLANFKILHEISRGGDGAVLLAQHQQHGELVALKKRHANSIAELNDALQEALIIKSIVAEHVVRCTAVFVNELIDQGKQMFELFFVLDYHANGDLFGLLRKVARADPTQPRTRGAHRCALACARAFRHLCIILVLIIAGSLIVSWRAML